MIAFYDFDPKFPDYRTVPSWRGFGSSLPCGRETAAQHQVEHTSGFFFTIRVILPSLVCWLLLTKTPRERSLTVRWTHLIRGVRYLSGVKHTIVIQRRKSKKQTNKFQNTIRDGGSTALYSVYTIYIIQTALHCLNSSMYAHIYV